MLVYFNISDKAYLVGEAIYIIGYINYYSFPLDMMYVNAP